MNDWRVIVVGVIQNSSDEYLICRKPKNLGVFPGQWARLFLLALAAAALAAAWPAWRLRRAAPLDLLRSFSNER